MRISFDKYPIDIILCILWSVLLIPVSLSNVEGLIKIILGLPFILFIPGYLLVFTLFPARKTDKSIGVIERVALSFGLSIAVVPLIGLGLNFTPWGIRLEPYLISIFFFIIGIGLVAIYRWIKTDKNERFIIFLDLSFSKSESKLDKVLTTILVVVILIALVSFIYVLVTPKIGEKFTELYILGPGGKAIDYPRNLSIGGNASVTIGLVNHEYRIVNYTLEIWLINQTMIYNELTDENMTEYNNMWFMDKINISLNHAYIDIEESWEPQWEYNYSFNMNKSGEFKLAFLLFTEPTDNYILGKDYRDIADQKIENAYREIHLWISVK